jgi:PiT family inorganic phosphate transporter
MNTLLIVILLLACIYGYINGINGSANIVATIVSARAMKPRLALWLASFGIVAGPFLLGSAVSNTIGSELMRPETTTPNVVIAALASAILWSSFTLWLKLPSSISHSLIGGILGAVWFDYGINADQMGGLQKTLLALFISPLLGFMMGYIFVKITYRLSITASPKVNRIFNRAQVLASMLMAISYGSNEAQKITAMMALGLLATGVTDRFIIPQWTIALGAGVLGLGSLIGGWRLISTLGGKFYKIRPIHGFGAQLASTFILFGVGALGGPVSGSQVVTSSILGAGSADRIKKVRWGVGKQILMGWLFTLPVSALISAIIYQIIEKGF